ncbi:membrane protein [Candidatus Kinetoplastibacterium blastocrithidii TCC012E]|uniref:Membrane protein n=1 Tax=Candidatus Kinetoplastidibacterium blastocrithidiae TCC012E TaxID=1208922 RepID=M1MCP0_9PROT|nr:DMT family transporter [Candidatus Kinetoplastibacterium blastocrithidii]AFZ83464.1 integral membrane protein [Candidatus Kinetoplastibacterium blastocrithidii (ex Strigomonas culicis)]AGF49560.1 membrane protein [Candidatus Kinetoplastibacterium blastocrithidii TCC012E]
MIVGFLYLFLSITCSILVSITLKFLKKNTYRKSDLSEIVLINYIIATILSLFFFKTYNENLLAIVNNNMIYILLLGCLLPIGFISMSKSIEYFGVAKSEIFQRISVVMPIIAAFTIFDDKPCAIKIIYVASTIFSILCLLDKREEYEEERVKILSNFKWPILVCFTYGMADIMFKKISGNHSLTNCLFLSFLIASIAMIIYILSINKKFIFSKNNIINGLLIGSLNWVNIFSYIKAHKCLYNMPSTVFIIMNLGVVILGTIAGTFLFRERLSRKNIIGMLMAISSILMSIRLNR